MARSYHCKHIGMSYHRSKASSTIQMREVKRSQLLHRDNCIVKVRSTRRRVPPTSPSAQRHCFDRIDTLVHIQAGSTQAFYKERLCIGTPAQPLLQMKSEKSAIQLPIEQPSILFHHIPTRFKLASTQPERVRSRKQKALQQPIGAVSPPSAWPSLCDKHLRKISASTAIGVQSFRMLSPSASFSRTKTTRPLVEINKAKLDRWAR
jgi:hypothetical protein